MKGSIVRERATRIEQNKPELAKQKAERNRKKADGGIHAVSHTVRSSRKQEAAAAHEVKTVPRRRWKRGSFLPGMPELAGYHIEYVRRDNQNRGDMANVSKHLMEGWEFCRKTDFAVEHVPTQALGNHGEVIGNNDSLLMKIPEEMWADREAEYQGNRDRATRAVSSKTPHVDESHPAMPLTDLENRSTTNRPRVTVKRSVGGGSVRLED